MLLVLQMVLGGWIPAVQAPFNVAPSAAFLHLLGLNVPILALLLHFGYGAAGSAVLLWLFWDRTGVRNGVGLAVVLWLGMMLVLSPMLGWGFFGWPGTPDRPAGDPLYLQGGMLLPASDPVRAPSLRDRHRHAEPALGSVRRRGGRRNPSGRPGGRNLRKPPFPAVHSSPFRLRRPSCSSSSYRARGWSWRRRILVRIPRNVFSSSTCSSTNHSSRE